VAVQFQQTETLGFNSGAGDGGNRLRVRLLADTNVDRRVCRLRHCFWNSDGQHWLIPQAALGAGADGDEEEGGVEGCRPHSPGELKNSLFNAAAISSAERGRFPTSL